MNIIVRAKADEDLDDIFGWIAKDNPRAAAEMIRRIRQRIGRLANAGREAVHTMIRAQYRRILRA